MTRRVVTAREQEELRSPWRTASSEEYFHNWQEKQSSRTAMPAMYRGLGVSDIGDIDFDNPGRWWSRRPDTAAEYSHLNDLYGGDEEYFDQPVHFRLRSEIPEDVLGRSFADPYDPRNDYQIPDDYNPTVTGLEVDDGSGWRPHPLPGRQATKIAMPMVDAWDHDWQRELGEDERSIQNDPHPGPWYHGTDYPLDDGTELTPGGGRSRWDSLYDAGGGSMSNRRDWVWMARTPEEAQQWGTYVHEVEPHDEGPWQWNGGITGDEGYVSPRATIRQRVDMGKRRFERLQQEKGRTAAAELPEGLTFRYHDTSAEDFPDVIDPSLKVKPQAFPAASAHLGDQMVGYLQWNGDHPRHKGRIWEVRVNPEHQRKGIATALFDWVTDTIEPDLHHSNDLSEEGAAWRASEEARPLASERYEAWRRGEPLPKRFAMPTFHYIRNNNGLRGPENRDDFDQGIEPWGRYMTQVDPGFESDLPEGWERGTVDLDNPRYLDHDGWKQRLSEEYGGLTGRELSEALLATGHDGVVTSDKYGPNEFVDIRPKNQRTHRVGATLPPGYRVELVHTNGYGSGIAGVYGPRVKKPGDTNWSSAISWDSHGVIRNIDTKENHRGKGLARGLYEHVRDTWRPDLMHDHALTPDGKGFADAVGGLPYDDAEYQRRVDQSDRERKMPWEERRELMRSRGWPESAP